MAPRDGRQFAFDSFLLDPARARLWQGNREVALRPKTYELLAYLVLNPGRVVSKQELFEAVWPGVVVTEDSLVQCIHEIRDALADRDHALVRTVARRGYEFAIPVREVAGSGAGHAPGAAPGSAGLEPAGDVPPPRVPGRRFVATTMLAVTVAIVGLVYWHASSTGADPAAPPPLSLVVLPLANLNGDADQEYFAAALGNDLTTDLSRIRYSFVIARNTAESYRGKPRDVTAIGRELGVRYVVDGSVYRRDENVQVTVRLIEAATGRLLWSNRFDGERKSLGELQQRVTDAITRTLQVEMVGADVARSLRERPQNPDVRDLEMRGWALWNRQTPESIEEARRLLQQAVALDPDSLYAWTTLSATYTTDLTNRWMHLRGGHTREEWLQKFHEAAVRVHALNPNPTNPIPPECTALLFERKVEQSLACRERVLEQFPSDPVQYQMAANTQIFLGKPEKALALVRQAIRLSPRDSRLGYFHGSMAAAHLMLGDYREAAFEARTAVREREDYALGYSYLAAAAAQLDDLATAREALAEYRRRQPGVTVETLRAERWSDHPEFLAQRERYLEALRKAGLPD